MTESPLFALHQAVQSSTRREVLQRLAGVTMAGIALAPFGENSVARNKQKKRRRRKKRKKNQPPVQPAPEIRADATCPAPATTGFTVSAGVRLGQSFTAGLTGELVRAELVLNHFGSPDGEYFLRLSPCLKGLPEDVVLARASVDDRTLPEGESVVVFTFDQPARVTAAGSYALILARAGDGQFGWSGVRDECSGRAFFSTSITAPFEPSDETDFLFTTFVRA